ncbi:hypothetical protein KQX54_010509 [Cotesia glomerata]|uniref:Uncharacterized protein n=1 Tax=Cotesia glomerata TaxID=32391 RepID=A0AAV7I6X5_COTGL|nr:hypothetical protein KQX54_010509 [Cotesia glomerata]
MDTAKLITTMEDMRMQSNALNWSRSSVEERHIKYLRGLQGHNQHQNRQFGSTKRNKTIGAYKDFEKKKLLDLAQDTKKFITSGPRNRIFASVNEYANDLNSFNSSYNI